MKNIEDYKGKKYAIQCKTQEEWDYITNLLGYKWNSFNKWSDVRENSIIYCEFMCQGNVITNNYKTNHDCELLQAKDFMEEEYKLPEFWCIKITKENLQLVGAYYDRQGADIYSKEDKIGNWYSSHNLGSGVSVMSETERFNSNFFIRNKEDLGKFKEISFETFQKYVLKQDNNQTMQKLTVKKSEFKKVHDVACDTWKKKCKEYASKDPFSDEITFTQQQVDEMFEASNSSQKSVLEEVFGKQEELFNSDNLQTGEIMLVTEGQEKGKHLSKNYSSYFTLEDMSRTWNHNHKLDFKGKKLPKGTKIEIIAG